MAPRRRWRDNIDLQFSSGLGSNSNSDSYSGSDSGGVSQSLEFISSSDDEEANRDLSLDIVDRAKRRRLADEKPALILDISPASSEHTDVPPSAPGRKRSNKSRKRSRVTIANSGEEEQLGIADSEVTEVNEDDDILPNEDALSKEEEREPLVAEDAIGNGATVASNNIVLRKLLRGPRYFDTGDRTWGVCYNCGEEGHTAVECTVEKQQKPCFICGMVGHISRRCPQAQDCFVCKRRGHFAKDCPNKHQRNVQGPQFCLLCGDLGHVMQVCRSDYAPEDLKETRCYICGSLGHLCCFNYMDDGPTEVSCYNCGQSGHAGLGCVNLRSESPVNTAPMLCYKCGEEGHFARKCTKAKHKRWMLDSPRKLNGFGSTWKNRDAQHSRSLSSYLEKNQRKKRPHYARNKNTSSRKSRINGGWIVDDPDYPLKTKAKGNGLGSSSTPRKKSSKHLLDPGRSKGSSLTPEKKSSKYLLNSGRSKGSSSTPGRKSSTHWLDSGKSQGSSSTPGRKDPNHWLDSGRSEGSFSTPGRKGSKHWLDSGGSQGSSLTSVKEVSNNWHDSRRSCSSYNGKKLKTHFKSPVSHSYSERYSERYRPASSASHIRS